MAFFMKIDGFDWDFGNRLKCQKHGVSAPEIEALFFSGSARISSDPVHSRNEVRSRAVGRTGLGRWIFVAFTLRRRDGFILLRPVSARYMHAKEIVAYEKEISDL